MISTRTCGADGFAASANRKKRTTQHASVISNKQNRKSSAVFLFRPTPVEVEVGAVVVLPEHLASPGHLVDLDDKARKGPGDLKMEIRARKVHRA